MSSSGRTIEAVGGDAAEQARAIAVEATKASGLTPTAVKTSAYAAAAGDLVPVDASAGSVTVTLPTAPADKTRVAVKIITISGAFNLTLACGGTDVFNKVGGSTVLVLSALFQSVTVQYVASSGIWYVQASDTPLGVASGAAQTGTDNKVGGPGGTSLTPLAVTANSHASMDVLYAPQLPGIVMPAALGDLISNSVNAITAQRITLCRAIIPFTGILHDLSIYVVGQSGNVMGAIYDTSGTRQRLWQSGSQACGAGNAWQVIGDPALAVTAGQQLELAFAPDNATATFALALASPAGPFIQLPTNFFTGGLGAQPKLACTYDPGSFTMPSTIIEGNLAANTKFPVLIARIV